MKFRNCLLTAVLFLTGGVLFADVLTYSDFSNMNITEHSGTVNIVAFTFNSSEHWNYYLYASPSSDGVGTYKFELTSNNASNSEFGKVLADKVPQVNSALDSLGLSAADREKVSKAHSIYQFSVPFDAESVSALGLSGTNASGTHLSYAEITGMTTVYSAPSVNGMGFSEGNLDGDALALVYGKPQWHLNNGALFLVSVNPPTTSSGSGVAGSPLPTPVTTLLIALGFGVAFLMYRNRKQAKA